MYQVKFTALFKRNIKKLAKKYPRIKNDFVNLLEQLEQGVFQGNELQGFSGSVYKVRVASADQNKGKRGGFRVIYYVVTKTKIIYLMNIYPKATQSNLSNQQKQELKELINVLQ